jgi:hypothetical protein
VNSSGLIEKERSNQILQSNSFDTTWTTSNATLTGGQSGYDGSSDAWELNATASAGYLEQSFSAVSGVHTISIYAKQGTLGFVMIYARDSASSNDAEFYFDLATGVVGSTIGSAVITLKITDAGGGWYRCEGVSSGGFNQYRIYASSVDASVTGTGTIYIQDAQLESGLVATAPAIETTTAAVYEGITDNLPRLDYHNPDSPTPNSCPSLLLEPSRTNLYTHSEYSGAWVKTNWTTTDNYAISPEGVQNAFRAVSSDTSGVLYVSATGTTGQDNTLSVWAKSNTGGDQKFRFFANGNTTTSSDFTATTEWQRFDYPHNCTNVTAGIKGASSELSDILFYGFQQEAGSYPTSYIPTYGTSASRADDSCEVTGASDLIGETEGTIAGEFTFKSTEGTNRLFSISGADWNTIGHIRFDMISLRPQAKIRSTGADIAEVIGTEDIAIGSVVKFAVVYTSTTFKMFVNGAQIGSTDTLSGSLPSPMNEIVVDALGGAFSSPTQNNQLNPYKQALVFKTALTDAECIALTTI